jgi:hypothetical protein
LQALWLLCQAGMLLLRLLHVREMVLLLLLLLLLLWLLHVRELVPRLLLLLLLLWLLHGGLVLLWNLLLRVHPPWPFHALRKAPSVMITQGYRAC